MPQVANLPVAPYFFTNAYAGCYPDDVIPMDQRHVFILYDILRAWPFQSALELGSYCGASSTAFVEAINRGSPMQATFCDTQVTDSLMAVLQNCTYQERIGCATIPSWEVLKKEYDFDFVLVDACHDLISVGWEIEQLQRRRPLCIMGHDTSATMNGYEKCEGAQKLRGIFGGCEGYWSLEDNAKREGEKTERGLFFATTNRELFGLAEEVFKKWA